MFLNFVAVAYLITMGALVVLARNSIRRFDAVYRIGTEKWEVVVARLFAWTMAGAAFLYWIIPTSVISPNIWITFFVTANLANLWYRMWVFVRRDPKSLSSPSSTPRSLSETQQSC